ncbi:hypothetical protein ACFY0P_27045 [Streptomyces sp. NPDC001714]
MDRVVGKRATATTSAKTSNSFLGVGVAQSSTGNGAGVIQWHDLSVDD